MSELLCVSSKLITEVIKPKELIVSNLNAFSMLHQGRMRDLVLFRALMHALQMKGVRVNRSWAQRYGVGLASEYVVFRL